MDTDTLVRAILAAGDDAAREAGVNTQQTAGSTIRVAGINNNNNIVTNTRALGRCTRLVLHGCGLSSVPEGVFPHLTGVQWLVLSGNALRALPRDISAMGTSLNTLVLHRNLLEHIPLETLAALPHVETLDLGANRIESIPTADVQHTRGGEGREQEVGSFATACPALVNLSLDHNSIRTIPSVPIVLSTLTAAPHFHTWPSSLRMLTLSHNMIHTIPEAAFDNLHNLEILDLGHNVIQNIDTHAFRGLSSLAKLILTGNQLAGELSSQIFDPFKGSELHSVFLDDNPLVTSVPVQHILSICPEIRVLVLDTSPESQLDRSILANQSIQTTASATTTTVSKPTTINV